MGRSSGPAISRALVPFPPLLPPLPPQLRQEKKVERKMLHEEIHLLQQENHALAEQLDAEQKACFCKKVARNIVQSTLYSRV